MIKLKILDKPIIKFKDNVKNPNNNIKNFAQSQIFHAQKINKFPKN